MRQDKNRLKTILCAFAVYVTFSIKNGIIFAKTVNNRWIMAWYSRNKRQAYISLCNYVYMPVHFVYKRTCNFSYKAVCIMRIDVCALLCIVRCAVPYRCVCILTYKAVCIFVYRCLCLSHISAKKDSVENVRKPRCLFGGYFYPYRAKALCYEVQYGRCILCLHKAG